MIERNNKMALRVALGLGLLAGGASLAQAQVVAQAQVGTTPKVRKAPAKPTAAQAKAAAVSYKASLKAGREAAQRKDYPEAIKQLLAAKALAPDDATVLAELGWAQFNGGKLDDANYTLAMALLRAESNKTRGMIQYNLGRVYEAQSKPNEAWDAYRRSLAARPNETVSRRLADLKTPAFAKVASPEHFCAELKALWDCEEGPACSCKVDRIIESPDAATGGAPCASAGDEMQFNHAVPLRAALLRLQGEHNGSLDTYQLVVETGSGGWQAVGTVAENWSPGVSYIHNNGEVKRFEFGGEVGGCDGHVLLVESSTDENDGDYGSNIVEVRSSVDVWACNVTDPGGQTACNRVQVLSEVGTVPMIDGEPTDGKLGTKKWERTWAVTGSQFQTTPKAGTAKGDEDQPFALKSLGQRPGVFTVPLR
jgi:tetratricopeptide (TPR) repeat protein